MSTTHFKTRIFDLCLPFEKGCPLWTNYKKASFVKIRTVLCGFVLVCLFVCLFDSGVLLCFVFAFLVVYLFGYLLKFASCCLCFVVVVVLRVIISMTIA